MAGKPPEEGPDSVALSLRLAREDLGFTTRELAARIGVSPAFITLIETGRKRPSAENARALAKALGLPEMPLVAWVEMGGRYDRKKKAAELIWLYLRGRRRSRAAQAPDPLVPGTSARSLEGAAEPPDSTGGPPFDPRSGEVLHAASTAPDAGSMKRTEPRSTIVQKFDRNLQLFKMSSSTEAELHGGSFASLLPVPMLEEGADPRSAGGGLPQPVDVIAIDRRLLPAQGIDEPWAYRISDHGARHAPDALGAGDVVVLGRGAWPLVPSAVYAVQVGGRIELSRVAATGDSLVVLLAGGVELLRLPAPDAAPPELRGRVLLQVRAAPGV